MNAHRLVDISILVTSLFALMRLQSYHGVTIYARNGHYCLIVTSEDVGLLTSPTLLANVIIAIVRATAEVSFSKFYLTEA